MTYLLNLLMFCIYCISSSVSAKCMYIYIYMCVCVFFFLLTCLTRPWGMDPICPIETPECLCYDICRLICLSIVKVSCVNWLVSNEQLWIVPPDWACSPSKCPFYRLELGSTQQSCIFPPVTVCFLIDAKTAGSNLLHLPGNSCQDSVD